ncbi:MAG: superfamily II DNA helicase RecQ [Clostridium sp.]|jgi:superfamily II DNA helicase RecQ
MGRKTKIQYQLSDLREQTVLPEKDIYNILRAADEIILVAGRTMLAKIIKGSKDKKILEKGLDLCPSYGYCQQLTIKEITKKVDWMIVNNYLDIDYNGRLPMIVFTHKGWEIYKPFYADELYLSILNVSEDKKNELIEQLKQTNRDVVELLLLVIGDSKNIGFIRFLTKWEMAEVKKVRHLINAAVSKLKSV